MTLSIIIIAILSLLSKIFNPAVILLMYNIYKSNRLYAHKLASLWFSRDCDIVTHKYDFNSKSRK